MNQAAEVVTENEALRFLPYSIVPGQLCYIACIRYSPGRNNSCAPPPPPFLPLHWLHDSNINFSIIFHLMNFVLLYEHIYGLHILSIYQRGMSILSTSLVSFFIFKLFYFPFCEVYWGLV